MKTIGVVVGLVLLGCGIATTVKEFPIPHANPNEVAPGEAWSRPWRDEVRIDQEMARVYDDPVRFPPHVLYGVKSIQEAGSDDCR